ncbi:MAG TPA: sulfite exporter TauE/SafE family protein [Rhizomicrobium sp.]|nr:sulfite exporter TauE/SafE family protein [Rhizomicrobium sp.]
MDILHTTSSGDLGVLALGLVIAGVVGGLAAGMLGVGGGIVVVPVLYHVMATLGVDQSVRMHVAIGTSLAAIIPASLVSVRAHHNTGGVDATLVHRWAVPLLAGTVIGSVVFASAGERTLAIIFALLALPVALFLALRGRDRRVAAHLSERIHGFVLPVLIGGASAATGMGGATLASTSLISFGARAEATVGNASALGAIVALPAALGAVVAGLHAPALPPWSLGYVSLPGLVLIAPVLLVAEPAGAALAHMIDMKRLHLVFAALVAIITARMLWDALS